MWCSKVLVAYDGSASSRKALDLARSIGEQDADVELVLVHVVKLYSSGAAGVGMDTVFVADAEPVREELQQVADALRNPASVRLLKGEPLRPTSSCGAPKTRAATSSSWGAAGKAA